MRYISTRGGCAPMPFGRAVMTGLAPDGGLLLPESIPDAGARLARWRGLPYRELALEIMRLYADPAEAPAPELIADSYSAFDHPEVTPVKRRGGLHLLELFHGPTLSFKDVALQFLGRLFERQTRETGGKLNILGATSGDTGSAAIAGVRGRKGIRIFVLHPEGRTSRVQALQMTTVPDANVFNIAVRGTFDDCQRIVKSLFSDGALKRRLSLGAVNSINWARVLAQIVYYFYGAFRVMQATGAERVSFSVPTGNFGDIFAGYLAARMGLPVARLVLATNENDILARFFAEGVYRRGEVQATLSPSMDIQVASNFERYLYYRVGEDPQRLQSLMSDFSTHGVIEVPERDRRACDHLFASAAGDAAATLGAIREFHERHGYLLDPHSAVGVHVARRFVEPGVPMICLCTAHPAKFGGAIERALGRDVAHHPVIDALEGLPARCERLPASVEAVRGYLLARVEGEPA